MKNNTAKLKKILRTLSIAAVLLVYALLLFDAWRRQLPAKIVAIALLAWTLCAVGIWLITAAIVVNVKKYSVKNSKK
ncbi:MAG: hypothetical protein IKV55_03535 [Oscillospiraceae bacterium]|nr:hypothetical protein [Oscillospiraceae bacterium]